MFMRIPRYVHLSLCLSLAVFTSRVQNKADRVRLQMNEVIVQLLEKIDEPCCGTIKLDLACYECTNEEGSDPWQYDKIGNPQETDSALSTEGGLKLSSTERLKLQQTVSRKIDQPASLRKRKGQIIYCVVPEISLGEQEQTNIMKSVCAEGTEVYKGTDFQLTVRLSSTAKFKITAKRQKANCLTRLAKLLPFSSSVPDSVQISDEEVKVKGSLGGHGFGSDMCKVFAALRSPKKDIKNEQKKLKNEEKKLENIAQDGEKKLKNAISSSSAVLKDPFNDVLQEIDDVDDWLCEGFPSLNCCNPMVLTKQLELQLKELIETKLNELQAQGDKASTNPLDVSVTMGNTSTTAPGYDGKTPPAQKQVQQAVKNL